MIVCGLSDIHSAWNDIEMPDADICCIAGDILGYDDLQDLMNFRKWCSLVNGKYKHGIRITLGNHDGIFEKNMQECLEILEGVCSVHVDEEIQIEGKRIYFCPWTPTFGNWSWMKSETALERFYGEIPEGLDLLVTHGMPRFINDKIIGGNHCGSTAMLSRMKEMKSPPKIYIGGHLHAWEQFDGEASNGLFLPKSQRKKRPENYTPVHVNKTPHKEFGCTFYNVSIMSEFYSPDYPPTLFEI